MQEIFKRVSGFYKDKQKGDEYEQKTCVFMLKEYKQSDNVDLGRIDKGTIIARQDYDMS